MATERSRKDLASPEGYEQETSEQVEAQGPRLAHAGRPPGASPRPASPPPPPDPKSLPARLNRLEEQSRRLTIGVLLLGLLGAYILWVQLAPGPAVKRTLTESTEVKLVDGSGATRMFLRMSSESPILQLLDRNGNTRLSLGMRLDETPFIDLSDRSGNTRATFELSEHDEPTLKLYDENGEPSFAIN